MSNIAIRAESLGKRYRIGAAAERTDSLREMLAHAVKAPLRNLNRLRRLNTFEEGEEADVFWALRDVSFEVKHGEALGIIGRNGAGKSTLLKILSRIITPTTGKAEIHGRVGSLLEVGTGFHPELTGRDNIYLNGSILGMDRAYIARRFDEIVEFSGISRFIDTPVKRYSSGMYTRLAFAVAAHLEPEVLIVDEVLAVGDAEFQQRCLGKMGEVTRSGRTVLFVSHNMAAVSALTQSCIYLKEGWLQAQGDTPAVLQRYYSESAQGRHVLDAGIEDFRRERRSDAHVLFRDVRVRGAGTVPTRVRMGEPLSLTFEVEVFRPLVGANLTLMLKNHLGHRHAVIFSWDQGFRITLDPGVHRIELHIDRLPLSPGVVYADFGINRSTNTEAHDVIMDYPILEVVNDGQVKQWPDRPWGSVHLTDPRWAMVGKKQSVLCSPGLSGA